MEQSFSATKSALLQVPRLVYPVPSAPILLAVDASETHVGTVLQQRISSSWAPLAFFNKKLSAPDIQYSAFDRELLAAYSAIWHFRFLLDGRQFTLFTDHKPLTHPPPLPSPLPAPSPICLSPPGGKVSEVSAVTAAKMCGSSVPSSGSISSKVSTTSAPLIDYANLAYFEKQCTHELVSSSALKVQLVKLSEELFFCDLSTGVPRPLVPVLLHKPLLLQLHGLSHPGVRASRRLISQHFVSKFLSKDVGLWARSCIPCQRSKIQTHTRSSAPHIPIPSRRFSHLQVNE